MLELYIKVVTYVKQKFKYAGGLNTGGVFRVKSDYLSEHSDSFNEFLSYLNSGNPPDFQAYVDRLPNDSLLLADLLKRIYSGMPFDIISESCLYLITPENTDKFYESLGGVIVNVRYY